MRSIDWNSKIRLEKGKISFITNESFVCIVFEEISIRELRVEMIFKSQNDRLWIIIYDKLSFEQFYDQKINEQIIHMIKSLHKKSKRIMKFGNNEDKTQIGSLYSCIQGAKN